MHPKTITLTCQWCGQSFDRPLWYLSNGQNKGKFCSQSCSSSSRVGELNSAWKGGRKYDQSGYVLLYRPSHPNANTMGYIREHRLVMEQVIGRPLLPTEVVHHINGITDDNRPENLQIMTPSEHALLHARSSRPGRRRSGRVVNTIQYKYEDHGCRSCGTKGKPHYSLDLCRSCYNRDLASRQSHRPCVNCGEIRLHVAHGLCKRCYSAQYKQRKIAGL